MAVKSISAERLRELLAYDPDTGVFTWLKRVNPRQNNPAGCKAADGYTYIGVDGGLYLAHRLAWLHAYGEFPLVYIDHRNGDKRDNRLCNLRHADATLNGQNMRAPHADNPSGFLGVSWSKQRRKWIAQIVHSGTTHNLGGFETPELAHAAYVEAKRLHHAGCAI